MKLILASRSPRRKQLLSSLGYEFIVDPSASNEIFDKNLPLDEALEQVALDKAEEVAGRHPEDVVLAADTIVLIDGKILGKPEDTDAAIEMLKSLSDHMHQVKTGIAIIYKDYKLTKVVTSDVHFRKLSIEEIEQYAASGSPLDKAGGYGIQEVDFAKRVDGSFSNVIGLPLHITARMLQDIQNDPEVMF